MSREFIPFAVDTTRVLELLAKQIYQSPLALLRENTQNAFDATLLRKHRDPHYKPSISIDVSPQHIIVRDNGIGMTADDLKRHFWQAGSSSKNTDEAREAGVVGTFGIGAMANFGIADMLEVTTESAITGERTRCVAKRDELKFNQDCIETEKLPAAGNPGTEIIASIVAGTPIDVPSVKAYVAEFVSLLDTPVLVNGELVSGQPIEQLVPAVSASWSEERENEQLSPRLVADVSIKISNNADIGLLIRKVRWNGISLSGRLLLRNGIATLRTFRSGFGLATVSVGSIYQFGGVADVQGFQPTAGREALTTDSMQLLQNIISDIDNFASSILSCRPEADSSTPFMQWVCTHNRYDLCGKLKVSMQPGDRTTLEEIKERTKISPMPMYDGTDQTVIASYSTEDKPLLILARNNPRKQCELTYLQRFCNVQAVSNAPLVDKLIPEADWTAAQGALAFRIKTVLESDYFLPSNVNFGKISHGLTMLVQFKGDATEIVLDLDSPAIATIIGLYSSEYAAFGSMVKDFVRNAIFPKVAHKVPSSTRQGAEAFLRAIRRPREIFEYEETDTSNLSLIWTDYAEGKISLKEAVTRSQTAVRNSVQIVESGSSARVADVVPDVVPNEQTTHAANGDEPQSLEALPAIMRTDVPCSMKLLTIPRDQPALRGYRCFIALTEKVRTDMGDFFLQPHKTSIVWGGQKVLFIFLHHSGEFGLYYDLQTRDSISEHSGGKVYQTSTMVLKNAIYIPVPEEIEASFVPAAGERKRFEVRCDLLRVDGA
ncbi:TPA: ATP-binding protein [Pseudomonas aeruginosa]|uniref:ATP-binding protein n=1 Tax=Pseudomonas aeruginosa TaxID=287 RepID=UPI00070B5465|nr:ATP-binding protein [Pseudomonas aeruginosa]KSE29968.1 ATP-binding protein [Pseudomonas aeruginosa]MBH9173617.1 ATP-binding protein [Pseudomonas aeruginosa]MDV8129623.1 ATP-binding protein [Pseudomonas aeruginosa]UPG14288.1 ATP-binding protein [Pseudomonas aeruginosa]SOV27938.1 Chaperone protein HtpG [Pseudomonas aeruginosa]